MEASANVVKQLLLYGANVLTEDAEGKNAYDWTRAIYDNYDRQDMKDILKEKLSIAEPAVLLQANMQAAVDSPKL